MVNPALCAAAWVHTFVVAKESTMKKYLSRIREFIVHDHAKVREEAYLNEAGSLIDLEYRQRQIDRGVFRQRNY